MSGYNKEKCNGCLTVEVCKDCPELIKQAKDLIKRKGICRNTLCYECVFTIFKGSAFGCNPDYAVRVAKEYLKKYLN